MYLSVYIHVYIHIHDDSDDMCEVCGFLLVIWDELGDILSGFIIIINEIGEMTKKVTKIYKLIKNILDWNKYKREYLNIIVIYILSAEFTIFILFQVSHNCFLFQQNYKSRN